MVVIMNNSGGGGEDGSRTVVLGGTASGMMGMNRSPFTVLQWQELELQALIFKFMMAGQPVPPELVLLIQKSFESISHRFFHHPTSNLTSTLSCFFFLSFFFFLFPYLSLFLSLGVVSLIGFCLCLI